MRELSNIISSESVSNRLSHTGVRLASTSVTLNDFEWHMNRRRALSLRQLNILLRMSIWCNKH